MTQHTPDNISFETFRVCGNIAHHAHRITRNGQDTGIEVIGRAFTDRREKTNGNMPLHRYKSHKQALLAAIAAAK